jgi:Tol biopolymer transport system component
VTALRPVGVCVAVCAAMTLPVAVAVAAFPGANGRIAYNRPCQQGVFGLCFTYWSALPGGTHERRLLRTPFPLNFSADGNRIVYIHWGGIRLADANGLNRSWLGDHAPAGSFLHRFLDASFSPDGTQIAFTVDDQFPYGPDVYVMGIDGTNRRLVARGGGQPVFSPDGARIAYILYMGKRGEETHQTAIETVAVDGTDRRRLHTYPPGIHFPKAVFPRRLDYAPDGSRLVVVEADNFLSRIAIVDANTGGRTRLPSRVTGFALDAAWSPDGRWIAYTAARPPGVALPSYGVFMIRPDGTGDRPAFKSDRRPDQVLDEIAWQPRP